MVGEDLTARREELGRLVYGYRVTAALYVVAKLGIADRLAGGPETAQRLAEATRTHPDRLFRVLRLLAAFGVLSRDAEGRFGLTPLGELLRSDVPGTLRAGTMLQGEQGFPAFAELLHTVTTGETTFDHVFGMGHFEYLGVHPDASETFNRAMAERLQVDAAPLGGFDLPGRRIVVDVGGGRGVLLASILKDHPHLRGVLFDLPAGIGDAREVLGRAGVLDRCEIQTGDAFRAFPPGGDVYVLSQILHDWPDERAVALLRNCRRVLPPGGALVVRDGVLPSADPPAGRLQMDLMMMVMNGGRERTEPEWTELFRRGGFAIQRIWTTDTISDVLEATPVADAPPPASR